jgi:hypothetical protein
MKSALKLTVLCAAAVFSQMCLSTNAQADSSSQKMRDSYSQAQGTFRAGKIIGTPAKDQQGHSLGDVKDFTLNPQTGEMFALIDIGGGHWAIVPWQLVKVTTDSKGNLTVTVNSSKSVLQGAPSVTKDQWNSLQDPTYTQRIYSYFQIQPSGIGGTGGQNERQQGQGQSGQEQQQQNQNNPENQTGTAPGQDTNQQNQAQP